MADITIYKSLQVKRGNASSWTAQNIVLLDGEMGWEKDTNNLKIGDGVTAWNSLEYFSSGTGGGGTVISVNSKIGTVILTADDISDVSTTKKFTTTVEKLNIESNILRLNVIEPIQSSHTSAIALNTAKNTYPSGDASKVANLPANQNIINSDIEARTLVNDAKYDHGEFIAANNILTVPTINGFGNVYDSLSDHETRIAALTTGGGGDMLSANNLSDLGSAVIALTNLGITATAAELNYMDGVTSNVQTQLNSKGGAQNLAQVLGVGASGGGIAINGLGDLVPEGVATKSFGNDTNPFAYGVVNEIKSTGIGFIEASSPPASILNLALARTYYNSTLDRLMISTPGGSVYKGLAYADEIGTGVSSDITYDNTVSGLAATNVKTALDEIVAAATGGISALNQRKIDNARDFVVQYHAANITVNNVAAYMTSNTSPNENKKIINTVEGINSVDYTLTNIGAIGQSLIIDNDGTGVVRLIADSTETFIGEGATDENFETGENVATIPQYSRVIATKKKANVWRIDGNYTTGIFVTSTYNGQNAADTPEIDSFANVTASNGIVSVANDSSTGTGTRSILVTGTGTGSINGYFVLPQVKTGDVVTITFDIKQATNTPGNSFPRLRATAGWAADTNTTHSINNVWTLNKTLTATASQNAPTAELVNFGWSPVNGDTIWIDNIRISIS